MAERRDEGFLARWSRRKQAAREVEHETELERPKPRIPAPAHTAIPPEDGREAPRPDLPDPATLDASSDFSAFLKRDVPLETHRAALRRLWRLDPFYNRLDGLDDYCEDFTDQATVTKALRTAYKVGRGLLDRTREPEAEEDQAPPEPATQVADAPPHRLATPADPTPPTSKPGSPVAAGQSGPRRGRAGKS